MNILFKYDNPALEDISYLPKNWFEESVSCCTITDGKVTGERREENESWIHDIL